MAKEVCQRVRSDDSLDDVRIICISGMIEDDKIADLKANGAKRFPPQAIRSGRTHRPDVCAARYRGAFSLSLVFNFVVEVVSCQLSVVSCRKTGI